MFISTIAALTTFYYFVQNFPPILDSMGYLLGIFLANFAFDALFESPGDTAG